MCAETKKKRRMPRNDKNTFRDSHAKIATRTRDVSFRQAVKATGN